MVGPTGELGVALPDETNVSHSLSGSLYTVLRTYYDREPVSAEERLAPVLADGETASLLGVAHGAALMRVERVASDSSGTVVEFARDLFRPDRVEFLVRRSPDQPKRHRPQRRF